MWGIVHVSVADVSHPRWTLEAVSTLGSTWAFSSPTCRNVHSWDCKLSPLQTKLPRPPCLSHHSGLCALKLWVRINPSFLKWLQWGVMLQRQEPQPEYLLQGCWTQFVRILLGILAWTSIKETDLQFSFFVLSWSSFDLSAAGPSRILRQMQVQTTVRSCLSFVTVAMYQRQITGAWQGQRERAWIVLNSANWCTHSTDSSYVHQYITNAATR